jgi:hypothetical protein
VVGAPTHKHIDLVGAGTQKQPLPLSEAP